MAGPKEILTIRIPKEVKETLSSKASEKMMVISNYVSNVLVNHLKSDTASKITTVMQHDSDLSNIAASYQTFLTKGTNDNNNILLLEDKSLAESIIFNGKGVYIPLLPITRISNSRYLIQKKDSDLRNLKVIYNGSSNHKIARLITKKNEGCILEGSTSISEAYQRFIDVENSAILCGPILFSLIFSSNQSTNFCTVKTHIPSILTTHYIASNIESIKESVIQDALDIWLNSVDWFMAMMHSDSSDKSIKQFIELNTEKALLDNFSIQKETISIFKKRFLNDEKLITSHHEASSVLNGHEEFKGTIEDNILQSIII